MLKISDFFVKNMQFCVAYLAVTVSDIFIETKRFFY